MTEGVTPKLCTECPYFRRMKNVFEDEQKNIVSEFIDICFADKTPVTRGSYRQLASRNDPDVPPCCKAFKTGEIE